MPGTMGSGKLDQTGGASGRWAEERIVAQRNDGEISQTKGLWATVGRGKLLQRLEAHNGLHADVAQT